MRLGAPESAVRHYCRNGRSLLSLETVRPCVISELTANCLIGNSNTTIENDARKDMYYDAILIRGIAGIHSQSSNLYVLGPVCAASLNMHTGLGSLPAI